MKQRTLERCRLRRGVGLLLALGALTVCGASAQDTPAPLASATPTAEGSPSPASSASPAATPKPGKGGPKPAKTKPANPNKAVSKDIPFPLPIGEISRFVSIPQNAITGQLLSQLKAVQIKRLDDEHVEMEHMNIDLYQADGKTDFHIDIPTSVFNLKTHIIHSEEPVSVRTQDFELTGEKMEFDTVERSGKLIGKVRMIVHNLKKVAGDSDETKNE